MNTPELKQIALEKHRKLIQILERVQGSRTAVAVAVEHFKQTCPESVRLAEQLTELTKVRSDYDRALSEYRKSQNISQ